jgi:membrane-bound serine protease (ClpP class)
VDAFVVIAIFGFALLLAELLLPTGGLLAAIGVAGLVTAGVLAIGSDSRTGEYLGAGLITVGLLSAASFYYVTRKVLAAHRSTAVRTGIEELVGAVGEARTPVDPEGRVWLEGTLWAARLAEGSPPARSGDRVMVEAVDGLTLVVRPEPAEQHGEGGS